MLVRKKGGEVDLIEPGRGRLHGRLAAADGVGRVGDDPVPRARRRQPGADGRQHAAPGRSAAAQPRRRWSAPAWSCAPRSTRGRRYRRQARRSRGAVRRLHHGDGRRRHPQYVPAGQVRSVEPGHELQPEADRRRGRPRRGGPGYRRRAIHRPRRDGARQEPAGGVHAVGGPQLRGRDHPQPAPRAGRRADLDPHRGARGRRARHEAGRRGDHPGHPERVRGGARRPRRAGHRAHRRGCP